MAFSFGRHKAKQSPLPSPESTFAPSPFTERLITGSSSCSGESDDRHLPGLSLPPLIEDRVPGVFHCTRHTLKRSLFVAVPLVALVGLLVAGSLRLPAPVKIWDPDLRREFQTEPFAKSVIRKFDAYNMARGGRDNAETFRANVEQYLAPDLLYESVGFGTWKTPSGWARGEEMNYGMAFPETVFTQMLFFGDRKVATTTTYGRALWGGDLFGIKAPQQWVTLRITDFYSIREEEKGWGRVSYNFMMIDWADALRQVGRRMLPQADLEEGLVLPPSANDGVPAPLSALVQAQGRDEKVARRVSEAALVQDWSGEDADLAQSWHSKLHYYGPGGIGLARNSSEYRDHVLSPFRAAFAGRRVAVELSACEGNYCGFFGRMHGEGVSDWLGLPTRGRKVAFRFAMHYRIVGDKVAEGWTIFDFPGLFEQLGMDFFALAAAGGRL